MIDLRELRDDPERVRNLLKGTARLEFRLMADPTALNRSLQQIIEFYYPGTSWGEVKGLVRVLITGDTTRDLVVSPAPRLRVRDLGSRTTYPLPDLPGVKRWRLEVEDGVTVVDYLTDRWNRWLPEGVDAFVGDAQLRARGPLTLWTPSGPVRYRGTLRAASPEPGSADRDTVNIVSVDNYVKGVIPAEMPASWHPEAVRAQAVAVLVHRHRELEQGEGVPRGLRKDPVALDRRQARSA